MRINVSIDNTLLTHADEYCKKYNYGRSELIAQGLRSIIYGEKKNSTIPPKIEDKTSTSPKNMEPKLRTSTENSETAEFGAGAVIGWCQGHWEKDKNYPLEKITYEDENGYEVVKDKWLCPSCILDLEHKGVGKITSRIAAL